MDDFSAGRSAPTDVDESVSETTQRTVTEARGNRPLWPMLLVLVLAVVLISVQVSRRRDASVDIAPEDRVSVDVTPANEGPLGEAGIMPVEAPPQAVAGSTPAAVPGQHAAGIDQPPAPVDGGLEPVTVDSTVAEERAAVSQGVAVEGVVEQQQADPDTVMPTTAPPQPEVSPSAIFRLWVVNADAGLEQIMTVVDRLGGTAIQEAINAYAVYIQIAPPQRALLEEELGRIGLLVPFDAAAESPPTDLFRLDLMIYEDQPISDDGDASAE